MSEGEEKSCGHCQGTVDIILPPTYDYNLGAFDNEDSFPNLTFVINGLEKPLRLHKITLVKVSKYIERVLKEKREKGEDGNEMEWMYETRKEVDKQVVVKALRFCYGESVSVGVKDGECCAMISMMKRLDIICQDVIIEDLMRFIKEETKKEVETGVELLKCVQDYPECLDKHIDEMIASIMFTKKNIIEHYDDVVSDCLMRLPKKYLDFVEYQEGHCRTSEFGMRVMYVREHEGLGKEDKEGIMKKCKWDDLNIDELRELKQLEVLDSEAFIKICFDVIEQKEKELAMLTDMHKERMREYEGKSLLQKPIISSLSL